MGVQKHERPDSGRSRESVEELFFASENEKLRNTLQQKEETKNIKEALSAWKDYVSALISTMDATTRYTLEQELLSRARTVAESAGGFLGIGTISSEEEDKLAELARAFPQA